MNDLKIKKWQQSHFPKHWIYVPHKKEFEAIAKYVENENACEKCGGRVVIGFSTCEIGYGYEIACIYCDWSKDITDYEAY